MAGLLCRAQTGLIPTGTALRTLINLQAPANQRLEFLGFRLSFDGITATDPPILVTLRRQSHNAEVWTGALTPVKLDNLGSETIQAVVKYQATTEPTQGDILDEFLLQPYYGNWREYFPYDRPHLLKGGDWVGLTVTASVGRNAVAQFDWRE